MPRNKGKKWRPMRLMDDGSIYEMDNLRMGPNGERLNTTGCYGSVSTFGIRGHVPGPKGGKNRSIKKKAVCRLVSRGAFLRASEQRLQSLIRLRGQILIVRLVEDLSNQQLMTRDMKEFLPILSQHIFSSIDKNRRELILKQDLQREKSIEGNFKGKPTDLKKIRKLQRFISIARKSVFLGS